jgi:para-nitrobenzyl esterase
VDEEGKAAESRGQSGPLAGRVTTRREFLRGAGIAGASMVLGTGLAGLLAACSKSTPPTIVTTTVASSTTITTPTASRVFGDPVPTDKGLVSGALVDDSGETLHYYRGVPYAAPPVGDLRFKPPAPVTPWEGVRACTQFTHIAPQPSMASSPFFPGDVGIPSEDCLYLDVVTPAKSATDRFPVMVFLHGGGVATGAADSRPSLDPSLARHGVVLVGVNHRVGVMGLLALPELSAESPDSASGNYEFLDLLAALQWVQRSIASFGGDPNNVTIFGESGGSAKAFLLLASPLANGFFHQAICQSGPPWGFLPEISAQEAQRRGKTLLSELGLSQSRNVLQALRTLPWESIVQANVALGDKGLPTLHNTPVIDGYFLRDAVRSIFRAGKQNVVPMIGGDCLGEVTGPGAILMPSAPAAYAEAFEAMARRGAKSYCYMFTHVPSKWRAEGCVAFHSIEMPYLFGDLAANALYFPYLAQPAGASQSDPGLGQVDQHVSQQMQIMWTNFAKVGDPSIPGVISWPAYATSADKYLDIGATLRVRSGFSRIKPLTTTTSTRRSTTTTSTRPPTTTTSVHAPGTTSSSQPAK